MNQISQINNLLTGKDPDKIYESLLQNNPQFRKFVEDNRGKTPEQIASENGLDLNKIRSML